MSDGQQEAVALVEPNGPGKVRTFAELVKFEHSIFALPYAYLGALYGAVLAQASAAAVVHASPTTFGKLAEA